VGFGSGIGYGFPVGFGLGIEYRENSLVMSGTVIPVGSPFSIRFGSRENLPSRWGMGMGIGRFSLDGGRFGDQFPIGKFPVAIPSGTKAAIRLYMLVVVLSLQSTIYEFKIIYN
jgi:hypothetical protein